MKNEWVLITGSSRGLGRAMALVFAKNNYDIILHGRDQDALDEVKKEIKNIGANGYIINGDLRCTKTLDSLAEIAKKKDISVLVNNAGSGLSSLQISIDKLTDEQIDEIIESHLTTVIKLTKRIYPILFKKRTGTIININSIIGLESKKLRTAYCASKWGLRGFTNSLRLEAEERNIRVMEVYSTRIKTRPEFLEYGFEPEEVARKIYKAYEIGRLNNLILDGRPKKYRKLE